ncbi:MAG: RNA polymerase sigma factor RpoH [Enterobacterales bacterium]
MIKDIQVISYFSIGGLESYIKLANSNKILNAKEEKYLANKFFYENDLKSAKKLILSHLRFVIYISKSYSGYGLLEADLIQEGNIGLMKAVRRFNPTIGVRLISFAVYWIKSEIHEFVLKNWRIVKIATTKTQRKLFFNLRKVKQKLGWFNKHEMTLVAKKLGVTSEDIKEMELRMCTTDKTLDHTFINKNFNNIQINKKILLNKEKISNIFSKNKIKLINHNQTNKLYLALECLDDRSKKIIKLRWLKNKNKEKITLQKLANYYSVSAERIRQLEKNAIKKIRLSLITQNKYNFLYK